MTKTFILSSFAILLGLIVVGLFITTQQHQIISGQLINSMEKQTGMKLSDFDKELAVNLMDKNSDGKCDSCGMPVEMCIDSGQIECNMDSKSTIGVLGSAHIHTDWKIYINGKPLDLSGYSHMERMQNRLSVSSFIHVDSGSPAPEKTGDVLHMHATGVPLWIFFKSIEVDLPENMKVYVNGKEISDWKDYVFADLDKILITDDGNLEDQLNSITNFAKDH